MADQSNNQYGPFTSALTGPLTPQQEANPTPNVGYGGKAATLAQFANAFINGARKGQRTKYERSEQQKAEQDHNFDSVIAHIMSDPTITQEGKDAAQHQYLQAKYSRVNDDVKGADKEHKDNPLLGLAKSISGAVLGPNVDKKHKDLGIDVNSLLSIATNPKYKINPQEVGSLENALKPTQQAPAQAGQQPQQAAPQAGFNLPGAPTAQALPPASPQAAPQATPPPPGTTAAAATAPKGGVPWTSQQEALADPNFVAAMGRINKAGVDFKSTELGQVFNSLPKAAVAKPGAAYTVRENGKDIMKRDYFDSATGKTTTEVLGEARPTAAERPTTTAEKRSALVDAYVLNGDTKEEAEKKVAKLDIKTAEGNANKADVAGKPKITPTTQLSANLLTSGKAKSKEEADKQAAQMMVDYQSAKTKAELHRSTTGGGGAGGALTAQELQGLVKMSIITGQSPAFGNGQSAIRSQYLKGLADSFSGGDGVGEALAAKTDYKADVGALNNMTVLRARVGSFEGSANKALDQALEASKNVPRDSSALVNGWDQYLTKKTVDDPQLQKLFVYTETAANEYARVIGSLTGASTNDARAQANEFIRAQLGEKSFAGAAEAMKTDMRNRTGQIDETVKGLRSSIANIGKKSENPPPPKQDDPIDPSVKSIQAGGKPINIGDSYKGKKILGFTKDHHLVTE